CRSTRLASLAKLLHLSRLRCERLRFTIHGVEDDRHRMASSAWSFSLRLPASIRSLGIPRLSVGQGVGLLREQPGSIRWYMVQERWQSVESAAWDFPRCLSGGGDGPRSPRLSPDSCVGFHDWRPTVLLGHLGTTERVAVDRSA